MMIPYMAIYFAVMLTQKIDSEAILEIQTTYSY